MSMPMSMLTLIIPSNRDLKTSRASLESAIIYVEKVGCRLVVTDNSEDRAKPSHFSGASPNLSWIDTAGHNAQQNLLAALSAVDTPFVLPMGDDDEIYLLERRRAFDLSTLSDDVIGVRPVSMSWCLTGGVTRVDRYPLAQQHSDERLNGLIAAAPSNNSLFYSTFRTGLFIDLLLAFDNNHPTRGAYCDWTLTFCLVAAGRILHDPATLFRYDLGRWSSKESLARTKLDLYLKAGLSREAETYWALLRFVDTHGMLAWKGLPLDRDERLRAMTVNAQLSLSVFLREIEASPAAWPPAAHVFARLARTISSPEQAYDLVLPVIDGLKPGLGEHYARFRDAVAA